MKSLKRKSYSIVLDATPYFGGSKVASNTFLQELRNTGNTIEIFTRDTKSWLNSGFSTTGYTEHKSLSKFENGIGFYLKNAVVAFKFTRHLIKLIRQYKSLPSYFIGISGPGVDTAMYAPSILMKIKTLQLIHGPVGKSRLSNLLLRKANIVGYLKSERSAILKYFDLTQDHKLNLRNPNSTPKLVEFENGLSSRDWPSPSTSNFEYPMVFWAASLLKWKRLDFFQSAFSTAEKIRAMEATIAFIVPKDTKHPVCQAPQSSRYITAEEAPSNIDSLRSSCNVFVSTSISEPFGLSILEALAAGLCVVIPSDGAYWDQVLQHKVNCFKYSSHSKKELSDLLVYLADNMDQVKTVSRKGKALSEEYTSEEKYRELVKQCNEIKPSFEYYTEGTA